MSLKRNTFWNLLGNGLPFVLGVITIPYLIKHLGVEAFGILTLIWGLIGYFSLFDFGLGRALTQQVAARLAANDKSDISHLVKSGLIFTALTGLLGGLLLFVLATPLAKEWLKVSVALQSDTSVCLMVAAMAIPLTTAATGLRGVLEAYEDFRAVNFIRMGMGIASFGLPALCVMVIGKSLIWIVVSLALTRLIVLLAHWILVNRKLKQSWWNSRACADDVIDLLSFGAWMTLTNIIGPFMVTADRFVISAMLGASVVAYYTVPFEALMRVLIIPTAVSAALFPRFASQFATQVDKARSLYVRSMKIIAAVLLPICLIICVASYWGLTLWLGEDFAQHSWVIVCVMSLGILFNGIAFIPFAIIQANGNPRTTAVLHLTELMFYLPLLYVALHYWGVVGAAVVWTIRVGADLFCLMILANKEFLLHGAEKTTDTHISLR